MSLLCLVPFVQNYCGTDFCYLTDNNSVSTGYCPRKLVLCALPKEVAHMGSIIEDLYYGNIPLSERGFRRTGEYARALQLAARNEEKLTETLTEAQKETFGKFKDNTSELTSMTEVTAFTIGFKLGLRLTAEAYTDSGDQNLSE